MRIVSRWWYDLKNDAGFFLKTSSFTLVDFEISINFEVGIYSLIQVNFWTEYHKKAMCTVGFPIWCQVKTNSQIRFVNLFGDFQFRLPCGYNPGSS